MGKDLRYEREGPGGTKIAFNDFEVCFFLSILCRFPDDLHVVWAGNLEGCSNLFRYGFEASHIAGG